MLFYGIISGRNKLHIVGVEEGYYTPNLEEFFDHIGELEICSPEKVHTIVNPILNDLVLPATDPRLVWYHTMWSYTTLFDSPTFGKDINELVNLLNRGLLRIKV